MGDYVCFLQYILSYQDYRHSLFKKDNAVLFEKSIGFFFRVLFIREISDFVPDVRVK